MRRSATLLFALVLASAGVCVARPAHALGPIDIEVGAKAGGGTNPLSAQPTPLGFGLGGRAGVSFLGYYGGLSVMYYFGQSGPAGPVPSASEHALLYGVEAGYGASILGLITVRAQLGVGQITVSYTGAGQLNINNLYLEPGLTALVSFGLLFVGADAGLLILPSMSDPASQTANSSWDTAFTAHGQVGIKF
jgi:hypothetical protein